MQQVVLDSDGRQKAVQALAHAGVPVIYASGVRDALAPPDDAGRRAGTQMTVQSHPAADHLLPREFADWCVGLLAEQTGMVRPATQRRAGSGLEPFDA
jgi:hypothetical protein